MDIRGLLLVLSMAGVALSQSLAVPPAMVDEVVRVLPDYKAKALSLLRSTLEMESSYAQRMRKFGRNGNKRGSYRFVQGFLGLTPHGKHMSQPAFLQAKTMSMIRRQFNLDNRQVKELMQILPTPLTPLRTPFTPDSLTPAPPVRPDQCPYPRVVQCLPGAPYRTYDGTCNNLRNPMWGSAHTPLVRFIAPNYADAIEAPRLSVTGGPLPSPRIVSSTIHWDIDIPHHYHTLMVMQFGQFLDHDLSRTAITKLTMDPLGRGDDLEEVECGFDGCQTSGLENQACLPITVPANDTEFGRQPCMMFVRSLEVPNLECTFGPREQLNQLTSHLDSSHIYGSDVKTGIDLRVPNRHARGQLLMKAHPAGPGHADLLPQDPKFKECKGDNNTFLCFKAGDGRVNEFMGLTVQHMVWSREHNRIEGILHQLNPHWNGDRLYEETRRIINALWQNVIYAEYLPVVLGNDVMAHYGLNNAASGHWNGYEEHINPSVANVFATAAMRFGHTQIQGTLHGMDTDYTTRELIPISTQFRRPHLMYRPSVGGCDALMRGIIDQSSQSRDPFITKQVTRHLFADDPPSGLGEDLMSLNMQRGREHGLPGYNTWRGWCGLPRARTWDDLRADLPQAVLVRFRRLYIHVDDIDLWPAAVSELAYAGSSLGPTFSCILATQFRNLKFGDRFWFENNQHNPHPFSAAQLQSIRQMTLSKIICANSDTVKTVQPYVMLHPKAKAEGIKRSQQRQEGYGDFTSFYQKTNNDRVSCDQLPDLDLRLWQEQAAPNRFIPRPAAPQPNAIPQLQQPPRELFQMFESPPAPHIQQPPQPLPPNPRLPQLVPPRPPPPNQFQPAGGIPQPQRVAHTLLQNPVPDRNGQQIRRPVAQIRQVPSGNFRPPQHVQTSQFSPPNSHFGK